MHTAVMHGSAKLNATTMTTVESEWVGLKCLTALKSIPQSMGLVLLGLQFRSSWLLTSKEQHEAATGSSKFQFSQTKMCL